MDRTGTPELERTHFWGVDRRHMAGYVYGMLTAACWATSPILIRRGLVGLPSPLWGVTIGLSVAAIAFGSWWWAASRRLQPVRWAPMDAAIKAAVGFLVLAGISSAIGSVSRTEAIDIAPVVVVIPLVQTTSLWTIVFSSMFLGRHVERVNLKLVLGAVLVVGGAALVIVGLEA
jgi:drug/metabolite transporter (DMT)-like permease